jgi:hypothetical protein
VAGGITLALSREFRGYRMVDAIDPEGNVVQLRERMAGP